ncbi:MAG: 4a-hydroxytetrahydrobiopterin dehydratase [Anaerolineales bacterium]|nr:4a-hydroxytetrahydrobiopterin dehydratase [Anaerolineales bacterium]
MTNSPLTQQTCVPCRGDEPALSLQQAQEMHAQVPDWSLVDEKDILRLRRAFKFKDFASALTFTQQVGELAEEQGHHPVLRTEWGKVTVTWWTHKIKGLHNNDFIMAAKTDALYLNLG